MMEMIDVCPISPFRGIDWSRKKQAGYAVDRQVQLGGHVHIHGNYILVLRHMARGVRGNGRTARFSRAYAGHKTPYPLLCEDPMISQ